MERFFDGPSAVVRSASSKWREEVAWEAFQEMREQKMTSNNDRGTLYWSTEPDMPDDERCASATDLEDSSLSDRYVVS